jgi:hypothetical protein
MHSTSCRIQFKERHILRVTKCIERGHSLQIKHLQKVYGLMKHAAIWDMEGALEKVVGGTD